jgi:hypothetical protein
MKTKITIKKDTKAAQAVKEYAANKAAFRKAAREGAAVNHVRTNSQPVAHSL